MLNFISFLIPIITILLNKFQVANSAVCDYYPNYPSSYISSWTVCSGSCCSGYPTSAYAACCATTTSSYDNYSSYFAIPLGVGLGMFGLFFICAIGITLTCYFLKKKNRGGQVINPNWQNPAVQAQFAGKYPTTQLPAAAQYPTTANYPTIANNPTPVAPQNTNLYPNINNNNNLTPLEAPPKYDAFSNQPATTIINDPNNQMPVLPATINVDTNKY